MNYFRICDNIIQSIGSNILEERSVFSKIQNNKKRNKISKTNKGNQHMYRQDITCDYNYSNSLNKEII